MGGGPSGSDGAVAAAMPDLHRCKSFSCGCGGADDRAFRSVYQEKDEQWIKGLSISRDLLEAGGHALKTNITTLGAPGAAILGAAALLRRRAIPPPVHVQGLHVAADHTGGRLCRRRPHRGKPRAGSAGATVSGSSPLGQASSKDVHAARGPEARPVARQFGLVRARPGTVGNGRVPARGT